MKQTKGFIEPQNIEVKKTDLSLKIHHSDCYPIVQGLPLHCSKKFNHFKNQRRKLKRK